MFNARLHPPPQSMLPPIRHYAPPPTMQLRQIAEQVYREPALGRLTSEAREPLTYDLSIIDEQLSIPYNAKFEDIVYSARMFDPPASSVGWHVRPPPAPLGPEAQAKLSRAQQKKDDQVYRSMARRAYIPLDKQKTDARQLLKKKIHDAASVLRGLVLSIVVLLTYFTSNKTCNLFGAIWPICSPWGRIGKSIRENRPTRFLMNQVGGTKHKRPNYFRWDGEVRKKRGRLVPLIDLKRIISSILLLGGPMGATDSFLSIEWAIGAPRIQN